MTYCFAWKYQDAVFLIADTLVTQCFPADSDRLTTSLGEPHRQLGQNEFVVERQLKLRELKEGVAVAFAGNVQLAIAIMDFMQDNIARAARAVDVFGMVEASFGPFDRARGVQMLLVQGSADGECAITEWDTDGNREDAPHHAYIGSLAKQQADRMADLFQRLMAGENPSKEAMLLAGMAFVESLSKHEDLIAQHVGGVVCGLRVQRGKTIWPGDLIIVHHRDNFSSIAGRISLHARERIVYINSTYHGTIGTVLINEHSSLRMDDLIESWDKHWFPFLKDFLRKHFATCTRWLFIDLDRQVPLVFVVHGRLEVASDNLRIVRKDNGDCDLVPGADLKKILRREAPSSGPELRILEAVNFGDALPDGMVRSV